MHLDSQRGEVYELSDKSLKRLAFIANNTDVEFRSMVTLTYPGEFPLDGALCKKHLRAILTAFKRRLGESVAYLWFLEFQRRGAPHFHVLINVALTVEDHAWQQSWLSDRWYKIVGSGDPNHLLAGTRWENIREIEGARHYMVKYAAKTYQKEVPDGFTNVGRFWGTTRNITCFPVLMEAVGLPEVRDRLGQWPFSEVLEELAPRVLYNAAKWWNAGG